MTRRVSSSAADWSSILLRERSMVAASAPCVRANCTTAPMPSAEISLREKLISVMGKGFVRSVAKPVIFDILHV